MTSLLLFSGMTLAACLAPGPNVMLVIGFALRQGMMPALRAIIGISLINILFLALAALGLVALVIASAPLFTAVRYCGAAYLIYLGCRMLRAGSASQTGAVEEMPLRAPMLQGVLTHLANPKGVLYWAALLPQFLDPNPDAAYSVAWQIALFGAIATVIDFAAMYAYALLFVSASRCLRSARYFHWVEAAAGVVFIVSGILLGAQRF